MKKWVYKFKEGNADMRNLLGGKGANLAEMTNLDLPIPQGFTVTTEACTDYYNNGEKISDEIKEQILANIKDLEDLMGKKFGDMEDPLLVSVRSGSRASMPGMMDTILNLGLNDAYSFACFGAVLVKACIYCDNLFKHTAKLLEHFCIRILFACKTFSAKIECRPAHKICTAVKIPTAYFLFHIFTPFKGIL